MDRLLRLPLILILIALPLSHAAAQTKTWLGTESTSWNDEDNWNPSLPISNDTIVIPSTTNNPILDITAANFSLGTGSITIQNGAELDVNDKGISMSTITSVSGTSTGSITINTGAELNINGGTVTGGTITNNGTLKFNGKEVTAGTGTPFVPTTYTGSGEIHLVNTTGTDALTLPVSNSLIAFSGGITAAVTVNVTPSSRIVNLSGPTTIGTTGIGGVSKNFELNGGTLTGGTGETFTVTGTSSLGGTITSAANVSLNGNLTLSADTAVATTGTAALTFGGTIDNAPAPAAANRNLTVTTGTTNPSFSGNIGSTLPLGTLRIASGAASALTVTPSIRASNLALTGTSVNYTLTNSANSVGTLAANTGSLNYRNSGGINIGTVRSTSGVNTNNNDFTLTTAAALNIQNTVNAGTGTVSLQADGGIFQIAGGNITAGKLKLTRGTSGPATYSLNNGSNNVSTLAAANIGPTTYHDADGFAIGKIPAGCTVGAAGCTSGVTTNNRPLILQAGAGVTQSSGADIVVSALRLKGTSASYSLNNSGNNARIIYGDPDVTGSISYNDTNALDIGLTIPGTTPGSPPTSFGLTSTSGSVSVTAGGTLGVKGSVSAGTSVTLYSGGGGGIELEKAAAFRRITAGTAAGSAINLSTRGAGTITNTGTGAQSAVLSAPAINLQGQSGSSGAIGAAATPPSAVLTSGSTTVNIGPSAGPAKPSTLYLKNTDDITADGTLTLGALNNMASNKTIWVQTDTGNPLVPASGAIAAGTGSIDFRSGTSFTTAGAYSTTGTAGISLAARDALTVSHDITTSGGGDIDITSDNSTIALNSRVSTGTGTAAGDVVLNAGGAVTQSAAITADGLRLLGTGTGVSYTLTNTGNDVNTLAANTGAVSYSNTGILTIGKIPAGCTVGAAGCTVGVTTNNNDFNLTTTGTAISGTADIDISNKIDAGTGNVVFNAGGAVTQNPVTAVTRITAAGLVLKGSSVSYELKNTSNTVTTLAADAGEVLYFDSGGLSIGSVTAGGVTTAGVKTNGNNFRLKAAGAVTISDELNAGTGTTANILLEAAGGITQGSGAAAGITAVGLALTRPSSTPSAAPVYTLNNSGNSVTTLAANTGAVTYHDSGGVTVGSVTVDSVTITGIDTNAGALTVNASGAINQSSTPVAAITAGAANFTARTTASPQDIVLNAPTNDFNSVIFEGNNVTLRDSNALILGGSTKTSSAGGNLTVTTGGAAVHDLTDNGVITVNGLTDINAGTSGNVVLDNANDFSSPDPPAATGGVTITNAANVTLVDSNDIQLNTVILAGTGSLTVTVPPTSPGASAMYGINQTQPLSIPGNLTFKGNWNLRNNNLSAGLITTSSTAAGTGNLIADAGGAAEEITVSGNFRPDTFTPADSKVIFSGASTSQVGDNTPGRVTSPYRFNDIQISKDTASVQVTALNGWTILGSAALTQGRWLLGANSHTINGNWDSSSTNFTFVSAGSTVTFAGGSSTVETRGYAPGQSFNNFVVRKTAPSELTLGSNIKVDGNLTVQASSGAISAGAREIVIGGNWTYSADADDFVPGTGKVVFSNTAPAGSPKRITSGGSNFGNLTIQDNSRVNAKDALTVTGNLIFSKAAGVAGTAAPVLDIEGNSLTVNGSYDAMVSRNTWPAPDELGRLRLRGSAAVSIPASTSGSALGTVEYYGPGAAALGRITTGTGPVEYWNLVISGGAAVTLNEDVRVLGYSGNPKETLDEPVETEHPEEDDLMGLYIKDAGSSLDLNGKTLSLYGSFQNRTGAASGFRHGRGTVNLLGSRPALIYGKSTFFKFNINDQSGTATVTANDVGGKIVYFQQGSPITPASPVIEIANEIEAALNILGDNRNGAPKSSCAPRKCLTLPDPSPSSEWVYLVSSSKDTDWVFDKEPSAKISLRYVYIRDSDATIHPQSIPNPEIVTRPDGTTFERDIVITESSPGWLRFILVKESITQDSDADGRIDRLLVTSESSMKRKVDGAYERLEIKVDGYTVNGYSDGPESTQFYIHLVEGSTLDTDAVPKWRIINNETFRDAGVKAEVLSTRKDFEVPFDKARPIIGYALAAAGSPRNEVFIQFSEPVTDDNGGGWINNFNFRALENVSGNVSEVKIISPAGGTGLEEAVVKLGGRVTVQDIYENRKFIVEDVKDGAGNELEESSPLKYNEHRVSDLALGITGSGIVQPASAASRTKPVGDSGVETITEFDGTGFLEDDDIRIQAVRRKLPDTAASPPLPQLVYDNSVSASFRSNGLWLPRFSEGNTPAGVRPHGTFSGLVPRPWNGARSSTTRKPLRVTSSSNTLFEYEIKASDPKIVNNADLEFLFYMPRHKVGSDVFGNLYAARLIDDTAADWYRGVRPWGFLIRDLVTQAGGVTVLNNIINPMRSEAASLHYEVTEGGTVTIQVFDLSGNLVEILQRGYQAPGEYLVSWNGRNRGGSIVARGIYFIRYVGPGRIDQIRKVLVVK